LRLCAKQTPLRFAALRETNPSTLCGFARNKPLYTLRLCGFARNKPLYALRPCGFARNKPLYALRENKVNRIICYHLRQLTFYLYGPKNGIYMMKMNIRKASQTDADALETLYRETAAIPGGLAREASEITAEYIRHNLSSALATGISYVAEHPADKTRLVASIHAYKLQPKTFQHVLSELTIAVHPLFQGQGLGRQIFSIFLQEVTQHHPDILRVELITRESNTRAIALYQQLGFEIEGRLKQRIHGIAGSKEADMPMAWFNPNYQNEKMG
jgi:ribosomal protein S18 acetylase RimI-like enzyme